MSPQPHRPRPREWEVDLVVPVTENGQVIGADIDRGACSDAFSELDAILFRLGGACVVAAKREETPDGWVTTGLKISYESYMPPATVQQAPPEPANVPEVSPQPQGRIDPEPEPAIPEPPGPGPAEPAQPAADEVGPPPVSVSNGTEAQLEPATID